MLESLRQQVNIVFVWEPPIMWVVDRETGKLFNPPRNWPPIFPLPRPRDCDEGT